MKLNDLVKNPHLSFHPIRYLTSNVVNRLIHYLQARRISGLVCLWKAERNGVGHQLSVPHLRVK